VKFFKHLELQEVQAPAFPPYYFIGFWLFLQPMTGKTTDPRPPRYMQQSLSFSITLHANIEILIIWNRLVYLDLVMLTLGIYNGFYNNEIAHALDKPLSFAMGSCGIGGSFVENIVLLLNWLIFKVLYQRLLTPLHQAAEAWLGRPDIIF
jgi:hypothetical protein